MQHWKKSKRLNQSTIMKPFQQREASCSLSDVAIFYTKILWIFSLSNISSVFSANMITFNVALDKPVKMYPRSGTCGEATPSQFCRSQTDPQSLVACIYETCDLSCPSTFLYISHPGLTLDVLEHIRSNWSDCVTRNDTFLRPFVSPTTLDNSDFSVQYSQSKSSCFLEIEPAWMAVLRLMDSWNITIYTWVYVDAEMINSSW